MMMAAALGALLATAGAGAPCLHSNLTCFLEAEALTPHKQRCERTVGLALAGAGLFARKAHLPSLLRDASDCYELKAVWSRSKRSAEEATELVADWRHAGSETVHAFWGEDGWQNMLASGVDAVDLVLPIQEQPKYVESALRHGLKVISEKPAAPNISHARTMLAAVNDSAVSHWFVAENWRFETPFRIAARARQAGAIGKILAFSAVSLGEIPAEDPMLAAGSWRSGEASNWVVDTGVHMVAAMRLVLGERLAVRGVAAHRERPFLNPFDQFSASLSLGSSGVPGSWLFSLSAPRTSPREVKGLSDLELTVVGSNGSIIATRYRVEIRDRQGGVIDKLSNLAGHSVADALRAAAHSMLTGPQDGGNDLDSPGALVSPSEAVADLEVVESIVKRGLVGLQAPTRKDSNKRRKKPRKPCDLDSEEDLDEGMPEFMKVDTSSLASPQIDEPLVAKPGTGGNGQGRKKGRGKPFQPPPPAPKRQGRGKPFQGKAAKPARLEL